MNATDFVAPVQIGQRPGDLQNAMISAGRKTHLLACVTQKLEACRIRLSNLFDQFGRAIGIGQGRFQTER